MNNGDCTGCVHVPIINQTFGVAIEMLKKGQKVARSGWAKKGQWITLSCSKGKAVSALKFWNDNNRDFAMENGGTAIVEPCITMKNGYNRIVMGWFPSQEDMLAEDWMKV